MPVDVHGAAAEHAHIEHCDWPYGCDALTVGLGEAQPAIYLKVLDDWQANRVRFTLAHELGHVLMGWHIGTVACNTGRTTQVAGSEHPMAPVLSRVAFMDLEREANRFASALLLPWNYLAQLAAAQDMARLLEGVSAAQMSAFAALLGLSRALQPGFVFTFDDGSGDRRTLESPSTGVLPYTAAGVLDERSLRDRAKEDGRTVVSGRQVRWYRLVEYAALPEDDGTSSKDVLAAALADLHLDPTATAARAKSVQSVTGGLMSKERGSAEQLLAHLRHRVPTDRVAADLDPHALDRYLVAKVRERFAKSAQRQS